MNGPFFNERVMSYPYFLPRRETIIEVVGEHYSIAVVDILGKKRNREIVAPRQIAMIESTD